MLTAIHQSGGWATFTLSYLAVAAIFAMTGYCLGCWMTDRY